jgi:hypothetical protein
MAKVIVTGGFEDATRWEEGFRTHGELFKAYGLNGPIEYGTTDTNEVAVSFPTDNVEHLLGMMLSPQTAEAMEFDGINRETVRIFVLDGQFDPTA